MAEIVRVNYIRRQPCTLILSFRVVELVSPVSLTCAFHSFFLQEIKGKERFREKDENEVLGV
jgi:hypothetical protein